MDARRALLAELLELVVRMEQLLKAALALPDEDFDKLMKGEQEAPVTGPAARKRGKAAAPADDAAFADVQARLAAAGSREEGQRIVEESFARKDQLFAFARHLDLPVQRNDAAKRIREKVVTHTVGRRLSGRAVRGDGSGTEGS